MVRLHPNLQLLMVTCMVEIQFFYLLLLGSQKCDFVIHTHYRKTFRDYSVKLAQIRQVHNSKV